MGLSTWMFYTLLVLVLHLIKPSVAQFTQYLENEVAGAIRINCGGGDLVDSLGRSWQADAYYEGGENRTITVFPSLSDKTLLEETTFNNVPLYQTFRHWTTPDNHSYVIPLSSGSGIYWVRILLAELEFPNPAQRQFSIAINGVTVRRDFSILVGPFVGGLLEYSVPVSGNSIKVTFIRQLNDPYVSGIEVVPAPPGQLREIFAAAQGPVLLSFWDRFKNGAPQTSVDSEGRLWYTDVNAVLYSNPRVSYYNTTAKINKAYQEPGLYPNWTYTSSVKVPAAYVTDAGLSAQYDLENVADHLVVLHFAEIEYTKVGARAMDIYLQGELVKQGLDIIAEVGTNSALDLSFIVKNTEVTGGLNLQILPSANCTHKEPMLNAIEVYQVLYTIPQKAKTTSSGTSLPTGVIVAIVVGGVLGLLLLVCLGVLIWWQRRVAQMYLIEHGPGGAELMRNLHERTVRFVPLKEISAATNKWDEGNLLGAGGFGAVYKGQWQGEQWAVKRAKKASQSSLADFITEVDVISQLNHVNLVRLIGFCTELGEQIFVYEFCSNGTVHDYIKASSTRASIPFAKRIEMAVGSARGLNYLHSFAKEPLIHRDIKSENILLDADWQAKVADFGLLKKIETEPKRAVTTKIAGTRGYLDPEYYATFQVTEKSDVYSFGVVLLEMMTGKPPIIFNKANPDETKTLVAWTKPLAASGQWGELADPRFGGDYNWEAFKRVVELGLACVRQYGHERPPMSSIVRGLEKILLADLSPNGPPLAYDSRSETPGGNSSAQSSRTGGWTEQSGQRPSGTTNSGGADGAGYDVAFSEVVGR